VTEQNTWCAAGDTVVDDRGTVNDGVAALCKFLVGDGTFEETLQSISELAVRCGRADMAGITMVVEGRPRTAVFTDPQVSEIDSAQYRTGSGPCLDAFRNQRTYRIESTEKDERWPEFCVAAAAHHVLSSLSLPLTAHGQSLGALSLYASAASAFSERDAKLAGLFSVQAGITLANARAYWDARLLGEGLNEAMKCRAVIEQAKGILMACGGRSPDDAFQVLVRASQRENRRLSDVAADLVSRTVARPPRGSHHARS
jgi:transcriptional regulator with GAF, ATPase, and Fis domain